MSDATSDHLDEQLDRQIQIAATQQSPTEIEAEIDHWVIENGVLTARIQQLQSQLKDIDLLYQAKLLEKDLRLTQAESDLAALQLNQKQLEIEAQSAVALKQAVTTLTQWHAELTSKILVCDSELSTKTKQLERLNAKRNQQAELITELKVLNDTLSESVDVGSDIIQSSLNLQESLKIKNSQLHNKLMSLKSALTEAISTLSAEKQVLTSQLSAVTASREALEKKMRDIAPQLIPKWDLMFDARRHEGRPPKAVWDFSTRLRDENKRSTDQFSAALSVILNLYESEAGRHNLMSASLNVFRYFWLTSTLQKCLSLTLIIGQHLCDNDLLPWSEILEENPLALRKDRGIILWIGQTLKDLSDFCFWTQCLLTWATANQISSQEIFTLDLTSADQDATYTQTLETSLTSIQAMLEIIIDSLLTEQISTSISTRTLPILSSLISQFLTCRMGAADSDIINEELYRPYHGTAVLLKIRLLAAFLSLATYGDDATMIETNEKSLMVQIARSICDLVRGSRQDVEWISLAASKDTIRLTATSQTFTTSAIHHVLQLIRLFEVGSENHDDHETWSLTHSFPVTELDALNISMPLLQASSLSQIRVRLGDLRLREEALFCPSDVIVMDIQKSGARSTNYRSLETGIREASQIAPLETDSSEERLQKANNNQNASRLLDQIVVLQTEIERWRMREDAFTTSERAQKALLQKVNDSSKLIADLEEHNEDLTDKLTQMTTRCRKAEDELNDLRRASKRHTIAPPTIAAVELLKVRAVCHRLEQALMSVSNDRALSDWNVCRKMAGNNQGYLRNSPTRRNLIAQKLQLRNEMLEIVTRCPAIDIIKKEIERAGDQMKIGERLLSITTQELLQRQMANHKELLNLREKWAIANAHSNMEISQAHVGKVYAPVKGDLSGAQQLVMKVKGLNGVKGGRYLTDWEELQDLYVRLVD